MEEVNTSLVKIGGGVLKGPDVLKTLSLKLISIEEVYIFQCLYLFGDFYHNMRCIQQVGN